MRLVKSESQARTKTNDGELSILDAMENLVKAVALATLSHLSHLGHGFLSNYFGPPRSEFLTHSAAEGTVAAVCSQIFKVVSEKRHDIQNAVGGTVCLSPYSFWVSAGPHQG